MFCTQCGQQNPEDARFCSRCGAPVGRPAGGEGTVETTSTISLAALEGALEAEQHGAGEPGPEPADSGAREALPPGSALLGVKRGPNAGSTFLLDSDSTAIGRDPGSEVFLDDVTVSRKHAFIERRGGAWFVKDAGSLNGSYVNGEQADETALADHDEIQVGLFKLVFFMAGE